MRKQANAVPKLKGADFSYRYFHQLFIVAFMLVAMIIMCIVSESFRSVYNLGNLMNNSFALILAGLGQMYTGDGRFTENIDKAGGEGAAAFVAKAIEIYCKE